MTERRLLNEKIKLIFEDGPNHTQEKIALVLDISDGLIYLHNLVRDKIEVIPLSRVIRIEILEGGDKQ